VDRHGEGGADRDVRTTLEWWNASGPITRLCSRTGREVVPAAPSCIGRSLPLAFRLEGPRGLLGWRHAAQRSMPGYW